MDENPIKRIDIILWLLDEFLIMLILDELFYDEILIMLIPDELFYDDETIVLSEKIV